MQVWQTPPQQECLTICLYARYSPRDDSSRKQSLIEAVAACLHHQSRIRLSQPQRCNESTATLQRVSYCQADRPKKLGTVKCIRHRWQVTAKASCLSVLPSSAMPAGCLRRVPIDASKEFSSCTQADTIRQSTMRDSRAAMWG